MKNYYPYLIVGVRIPKEKMLVKTSKPACLCVADLVGNGKYCANCGQKKQGPIETPVLKLTRGEDVVPGISWMTDDTGDYYYLGRITGEKRFAYFSTHDLYLEQKKWELHALLLKSGLMSVDTDNFGVYAILKSE